MGPPPRSACPPSLLTRRVAQAGCRRREQLDEKLKELDVTAPPAAGPSALPAPPAPPRPPPPATPSPACCSVPTAGGRGGWGQVLKLCFATPMTGVRKPPCSPPPPLPRPPPCPLLLPAPPRAGPWWRLGPAAGAPAAP